MTQPLLDRLIDFYLRSPPYPLGHYSNVSVAVSRLESLMREDDRLRRKADGFKKGLQG